MLNITWNMEWQQVTIGNPAREMVIVSWQCSGVDGDVSGSMHERLLPIDVSEFAPLTNFSQSQLLEWFWEKGLNKEVIEGIVRTMVEGKKNVLPSESKEFNL